MQILLSKGEKILWLYQPTFGQQHLENGKSKHCLCRTFFKEYSTSFLIVFRLIDFALVVLNLLMFKFCVIIGISKIEFFRFSGTERVKQKPFKNHSKPPKSVSQSFPCNLNKFPRFLVFLLKL